MSARDTDTRFSSDTDFSEDPDGRTTNAAKGKVRKLPWLRPWSESEYCHKFIVFVFLEAFSFGYV